MKRQGKFRAVCLVCLWKGEHTSQSIVMAGHYAMKHVKMAHPLVEGFVAAVERLTRPNIMGENCNER
jgi:hypothetical protein